MNIAALLSSSAVQRSSGVATTHSRPSARSTSEQPSDSSSKVSLSKPAQLLKQLSALKESDTAAFKDTVTQLANQFEQLAASSQGPDSAALSKLADAFTDAAKTGDLSALKQAGRPPEPAADTGSQNSHVTNAYRKNGPPPPPPPRALEEAFSSALSSVAAA